MIIPFGISYALHPGSNPRVNADVLKAARMTVQAINKALSEFGATPATWRIDGSTVFIDVESAFYPGSNPDINARILPMLLEFLIALNRIYIRQGGKAPPLYQAYGADGNPIYYARTYSWETIPDAMARGFGDCKSLTAWVVAERREQGLEARPVFRWSPDPVMMKFHILVMTPEGWEDPSKFLGMGSNEVPSH
jgi:hypothetical protein